MPVLSSLARTLLRGESRPFERISYVHTSSHIFFGIPYSSALQIPLLYYYKVSVLIAF